MRKLIEQIYRLRWGPLPDRKKLGLVRLFDTIAETGFHNQFWMNGGLLLGCIRTGEPLLWDTDVDFSFWETDTPLFLEAKQALRKNGFNEGRARRNEDGSQTKWAFKHLGLKFEFFAMKDLGDRIRWYSHAHKGNLEMVNECPMHGLSEIELYGRKWLKPDDHVTYLASVFGNWKEPDPSYCYWRDSKAIVARYTRQR